MYLDNPSGVVFAQRFGSVEGRQHGRGEEKCHRLAIRLGVRLEVVQAFEKHVTQEFEETFVPR